MLNTPPKNYTIFEASPLHVADKCLQDQEMAGQAHSYVDLLANQFELIEFQVCKAQKT